MRRQYSRSSLFAALVVLAGLAMPVKPLAETEVSDLRSQIRDLEAAHGFLINGLERIGDDAATPVSGDLRHQIERLLEKYNFVLLHDADGSILEVRISQPIQAAPNFPNRYAIKTGACRHYRLSLGQRYRPTRRRHQNSRNEESVAKYRYFQAGYGAGKKNHRNQSRRLYLKSNVLQ